MSKIPIALSWSGGKDCCYSFYLLQQQGKYEIKYLLSFCQADTHEVNMHRIHTSLIQAQASAMGIPLLLSAVQGTSNNDYEKALQQSIQQLQQLGIVGIAFGDIFLQDLRRYREQQLQALNMQAIFPLWHKLTDELIQQMIQLGFKSIICCTNAQYLPAHWLGKVLDTTIVQQLPQNVDPCGENGEFHTFCYDGPIFQYPIYIKATGSSAQPMPLAANKYVLFHWLHFQLQAHQ